MSEKVTTETAKIFEILIRTASTSQILGSLDAFSGANSVMNHENPRVDTYKRRESENKRVSY